MKKRYRSLLSSEVLSVMMRRRLVIYPAGSLSYITESFNDIT